MQLLAFDHAFNLIDEACNMSRHDFVSKFLQEIPIVIVLLYCLSFHASKSSLLLFIISLSKKCMMELRKSINTLFTNLIRHDLARVRKTC